MARVVNDLVRIFVLQLFPYLSIMFCTSGVDDAAEFPTFCFASENATPGGSVLDRLLETRGLINLISHLDINTTMSDHKFLKNTHELQRPF